MIAKPASTEPASTSKPAPIYDKTSTAKLAALDTHAWPPPVIAPEPNEAPKQPPDANLEGKWVAFERPWLHKIEGAPPTFYVTFVRPDPKRLARVQIVALDARQLELDMAVGAEGPYPPDEKTAGKWLRGGKLPPDPKVATRVVAAFNGGFRFDQGAWGMSIRRREFMPPVKDVATMLMHDDGRLGFGVWGPAMKTPDDVRSLRQNLDPLVDDGVVNPRGRPKWGGILKSGNQYGQRAKRSGMCRTTGGHFFYFWGNELEAIDLGNAMKRAGCDFGMHLDMNVLHVGFVFMSFDDAQYVKGKSEALSPAMGVGDRRYANQPNPKEFFYATLRDPLPKMPSTEGFAADGATQPMPAWLPSVLARNDGDVRVTFVDGKRVRLAMVVEPAALAADDASRVLASVALGPATGALALDDRGRASISTEGNKGSVIFYDGKLLEVPADLGLAIGVTPQGDLVIAERGAKASATMLVDALVRAGCSRVIGARGPNAKLLRAGRDEIPTGGPDARLFVLAERSPERAYRFDLDESGAPRWPKVKTPVPMK